MKHDDEIETFAAPDGLIDALLFLTPVFVIAGLLIGRWLS